MWEPSRSAFSQGTTEALDGTRGLDPAEDGTGGQAGRGKEAEAALRVAEGASMEERHEEEAQSIQKEAMETVTAIAACSPRRGRSSPVGASQPDPCRRPRRPRRPGCGRSATRPRNSPGSRRARWRRASGSRRRSGALRAEISRYADMFKEHRRRRRRCGRSGWRNCRTPRSGGRPRAQTDGGQLDRRKEADEARRTLEMENATVKAQMQDERRRQGLEELLQMRGAGKSSRRGRLR